MTEATRPHFQGMDLAQRPDWNAATLMHDGKVIGMVEHFSLIMESPPCNHMFVPLPMKAIGTVKSSAWRKLWNSAVDYVRPSRGFARHQRRAKAANRRRAA